MNNQTNVKKTHRKTKTKGLHIRLSNEKHNLFEERAKERKLDKTSYLEYLLEKDRDDFQCSGAAKALNEISAATVNLLGACDNSHCQCGSDCPIRPFVIDIKKGVESLWQYSR